MIICNISIKNKHYMIPYDTVCDTVCDTCNPMLYEINFVYLLLKDSFPASFERFTVSEGFHIFQ